MLYANTQEPRQEEADDVRSIRPSSAVRGIDVHAIRRGFSLFEAGAGETAADWPGLPKLRLQAAGQTLILGGTSCRSLFIVCSGAFKSSLYGRNGNEQIVGFHMPGALIGFDALGSHRHACETQALTPSSVMVLPTDRLPALAGRLPEAMCELLRLVSREMAADRAHVAMLRSQGAMARLAGFLRRALREQAELQGDPDTIVLPMCRKELANYLGMAVETLCRCFARLQAEHIATVQKQLVKLHDHAALSDQCESSRDATEGA